MFRTCTVLAMQEAWGRKPDICPENKGNVRLVHGAGGGNTDEASGDSRTLGLSVASASAKCDSKDDDLLVVLAKNNLVILHNSSGSSDRSDIGKVDKSGHRHNFDIRALGGSNLILVMVF